MVDGGLVLHHLALALQLLVEAEHGPFARVVHVAGAAAAGGVVRRRRGWCGCGAGAGAVVVVFVGDGGVQRVVRGWVGCDGGGSGRDRLGVDVGDVASSAAAGVDVVARGHGGPGFGDVVWHFLTLRVSRSGWERKRWLWRGE